MKCDKPTHPAVFSEADGGRAREVIHPGGGAIFVSR